MKHLKFNITDRDIVKGKQADPSNCAIARALLRNKKVKRVKVFHDTCHIQVLENKKTTSYKAPMPREAQTFVRRFDAGLCVAPFELHINLARVAKKMCLASV